METNLKHSGTRSTEVCQREIDHAVFAREAAEEGIVLLKNEGLLPLKKDTKIALLGIGAEKTIRLMPMLPIHLTCRMAVR